MEKVWEILPRKFDDLLDQILYNRGVIEDQNDTESKERFLHPVFARDLFDPFLLKNVKETVDRIRLAVESLEKVGIFADYDADGIPGAALLYRALTKIGLNSFVYIPNREGGYGLSEEGVDFLISKGCTLIITVDLGIRNFMEAIYCREKKIDLIITDHHLPDKLLPEAMLVVNPKTNGDDYPFRELSGCGVAYKLVQGLSKIFPDQINESFLKWNLDLVAISTIADVVPLISENRVISKYGMVVMQKTHNVGLREIIKLAKIKPEEIGSYQIGYQIAPRINAPGRIDHATKSFDLLITDDVSEATELALWLNEKNETRQSKMSEVEKESLCKIDELELLKNKIIIVAGDWQKGVIGPTASRLVEKTGRPVVLFSKDTDVYTGSARSVSGVNIIDLLDKTKELIEKYGGHKGAAGLAVVRDKFDDFCKKLISLANKEVSEKDLIKKISVDAEVSSVELSMDLYEKIILLEPFGLGNAKPIFLIKNAQIVNYRYVGKEEKHLSLSIKSGESVFKAIMFSCPFGKEFISMNKSYDVVFNLTLDEWLGNKKLSLNIIDMRENG